MKLRNFIILLLVVLMTFAFASCNNEPKTDPNPNPGPAPADGTIYQIKVTEGVDKDYYGRDKIKLVWEGVEVNRGDVISLKYRSEREVYQWDIRYEPQKYYWVYETKKNGFEDPVEGDDGWYTLTYEFGDSLVITSSSGTVKSEDVDYDDVEGFAIYFRGKYVTGDIFEIKDVKLNDRSIAIDADTITSSAALQDPAEEFDWTVKNYAVLFAKGTPGEVDKTPIAEKVIAGGKVTGSPIAKEGYDLVIYTDSSKTKLFDKNEPINEEKVFYYEYVGIPRTVKFVTNSDSVIADVTIPNGDALADLETAIDEPELTGKVFKAWYSDAELKNIWYLGTAVTSDMTLYAGYGDPRTVTFVLNGGAFADGVANTAVVADGNTVAIPDAPTNGSKSFNGWYSDDKLTTLYDFTTPVTADIPLYAGWVDTTDVTLYIDGVKSTFKAALDVALSADNENLVIADDKVGLVFDGWYDDDEYKTAHVFTDDPLTGPIDLYGTWKQATLYHLVSTHDSAESIYSNDKFVIRYKDYTVEEETIKQQVANPGDKLSFRFRTTMDLLYMSVRGPKDWVKQAEAKDNYGMKTVETKEDGWTYVTYEFPTTYNDGETTYKDAYWRFDFGCRTIVKGDIVEIQDWTFNGEPLAIDAVNVVQKTGINSVGESIEPTYAIIEGGAYAWPNHTVKFEMDVADAIGDKTVAYGKKIEKPEDPKVDGYKFGGWFADSLFETGFNFNSPIFEDATIYAKFEVKSGNTLKVTFNPNYTGATSSVVEVDEGDTVTAIKTGRPGYFLDGWYTAASGGDMVDLSTYTPSADTELFAHWTAPTKKYVLTATIDTNDGDNSADRFNLRWSSDYCGTIEVGDIVTYKVKSIPTDGSSAVGRSRVRDKYGSNNLCSEATFPAADADGWVLMSFTVTSVGNGDGLSIDIRKSSGNLAIGDKIEIMAVALNGKDLTLSTTSTSHGVYQGAKPTIDEVSLVQ